LHRFNAVKYHNFIKKIVEASAMIFYGGERLAAQVKLVMLKIICQKDVLTKRGAMQPFWS